MSNSKVKGLLKGLRYISHIFENEKEAEMQIGFPTDVKHVAHIGWDGPSVNSPSWMNEFKAPPSFSSAPLCLSASGDTKGDASVKWVSEDRNQRGDKGSNSAAATVVAGARSSEDVPKTISKHPSSEESPTARGARSSGNGPKAISKHPSSVESPTCRERSSERQKTRRSSKSKEPVSSDQKQSSCRVGEDHHHHSATVSQPDVPRNGRRKKSSRPKPHHCIAAETYKSAYSDPGSTSATGSMSISKDTDLCQTP